MFFFLFSQDDYKISGFLIFKLTDIDSVYISMFLKFPEFSLDAVLQSFKGFAVPYIL